MQISNGAPTVDFVLDAKTELGESPVWDSRTQRLYFVDINGQKVHVFDPSSKSHTVIDTPEKAGTIVLTEKEDFPVVGLSRSLVEVDVKQGKLGQTIAALPEPEAGEDVTPLRFNDGKASPGGVLIVGQMHNAWRDGHAGCLYKLDASTSGAVFKEVLGPKEVALPNGMAWDPEKGVMYFVDTAKATLTAYHTDAHGVPDKERNPRLVTTIPREEGIPDGITVDSEGCVWVALAEGGAVAKYNPRTGDQLDKVMLPVKRVTACTFGGPDLDVLYVTTRVETGEGASEHWGGIFGVKIPGVKGMAGGYAMKLAA